MGLQFSYYCCPEDLDRIEAEVFRPAAGRLLMAEKRDQRHHLVETNRFALDIELMGSASLFLLLSPPGALESLVFEGPWLSTARSHVIEVGRCYIRNGDIRAARFWFEPSPYVDGKVKKKPEAFVAWARGIYRRTKRLLTRETIMFGATPYKEWIGAAALRQLKDGRLRALSE